MRTFTGLAWACMAAMAFSAEARATGVAVVYEFQGGSDGFGPDGGLVSGGDGRLYGLTSKGGDAPPGRLGGHGTAYQLTPPAHAGGAWTETPVYRFSATKGDGATPSGALLAAPNGVFYGATLGGGAHQLGTIFRLARPAAGLTTWTESVIYAFKGGLDGSVPNGNLLAGPDGALYGTTQAGGSASGSGMGTVFRLTPPMPGKTAWGETVLYRFGGGSDGAAPGPGLVADPSGALYGVTAAGGGSADAGTVFMLVPPASAAAQWSEQVIWRFAGGTDGAAPNGPLVRNPNGVLLGTTSAGGNAASCPNDTSGCGEVFRLAPPFGAQTGWKRWPLHVFAGAPADGVKPSTGVTILGGQVYGLTQGGGNATDCAGVDNENGCGTLYRIDPPAVAGQAWREAVAWNFAGNAGGAFPGGSLLRYGKTLIGIGVGTSSIDHQLCGAVFQFTP